MRAKRGSKPTAANVIKAMVIFRNMLIPWKRSLPKFNRQIISRLAGRLTKNAGDASVLGGRGFRDHG
jgi:hypothetical protein